jgi:hypothetical protein
MLKSSQCCAAVLPHKSLDVLALLISEQFLDVKSTGAPSNGNDLATPLRLQQEQVKSVN